MLFLIGKTGSREKKSLKSKRSTKTFTQDTKDISNYIYFVSPLCHLPLFNNFILTASHQEEPLGCSLFPKLN